MQVSVVEAQSQLSDLVRRAEAGEDVVLTRHGQPTVRLVPTEPKQQQPENDERWQLLEALQGSIKDMPGMEGITAANISDFLYDEHGLPA